MESKLYMAILASCLLAACCVHSSVKSVIPQAANTWQAASGYIEALNGRHYYLLEPGFSCRAGMVPGEAVPSWRDQVSISKGQLMEVGSRCNDAVILIGPVDDTIEVTPDLTHLRYQGREFEYFATPPQMDKAGEKHE